MKVLVAIPALNEAATIAGVIQGAKACAPDADIMVVDDGSADDTSTLAVKAGAQLLRHKTNRGKGEALKTAFTYAVEKSYDWIFTLDGDGQHDPRDLKGFFPLLDKFDLVLGNRMEDAGRVPFIRRVANRTSTAIVSALCGCRIYDSQTGFRAYRVELIRAIGLTSSGYELESEILIKAARRGFRIGHCRIQTIYAGEKSRFRNVADSLRFLLMAAKSLFRQ